MATPRPRRRGDSLGGSRGLAAQHRRTLMRPPVVKRQTTPQSGFCALFREALGHALSVSGHVFRLHCCRLVPPTGRHHTRMEGLPPSERAVAEEAGVVLCARETYLGPHAVLGKEVAARVPFASEVQGRGRGSTRSPETTIAARIGAGAGGQAKPRAQGQRPLRSSACHDAMRGAGQSALSRRIPWASSAASGSPAPLTRG